MVSDLISRKAAIEAICTQGTSAERDGQYVISLATAKQRAVDIIESLPTIDPVKQGYWIENGYGNGEIVCSNCGEPCATFSMQKPRDRYCKWCGAKMKGEEG